GPFRFFERRDLLLDEVYGGIVAPRVEVVLLFRGKGRLQPVEVLEAEIGGLEYRRAHRIHGKVVLSQVVKDERDAVRVCHRQLQRGDREESSVGSRCSNRAITVVGFWNKDHENQGR